MLARHSIRTIAFIFALFYSATVAALGLGEVDIKSALNQPLKATIEVISAPDSIDEVRVKLATDREFEQAFYITTPLLKQLIFSVSRHNDKTFIEVTTLKAVSEPIIDFILAVQWPQGRLLREYAILLDPVGFLTVQAPATGITEKPAAATVSSIKTHQPAPVMVVAEKVAPVNVVVDAAPKSVDAAVDSYGPIARNETLWLISKKVRADPALSIYQVMMSIYENNPHAFFGKNMNNLKAGSVLDIPDVESMLSHSREQVLNESRQHNRSWHSGQRQKTARAELRLVMPSIDKSSGDVGVDNEVSMSGMEGSSSSTDMETDIMIAMESADTARQENAALQKRISLLEIRLANLLGEDIAPMAMTTSTETAQNNAEDVTAFRTEQLAAVKAPVSPVFIAPQQPPSLMDELLSNWQLLVGAILGLLIIILVLVKRKRVTVPSALDPHQEAEVSTQGFIETLKAHFSTSAIVQGAEEKAAVDRAEDDKDAIASAVVEITPQTIASQPEIDEAVDHFSEVDVYLAYRRYSQAEELMKTIIAEDPDEPENHLKMLEIFFASENEEGFIRSATMLKDLTQGQHSPCWERALKMSKALCPDHALFKEDQPALASEEKIADVVTDDGSGNGETEVNTEVDVASGDVDQGEADAGEQEKDNLIEFDLSSDLSGAADNVEDKIPDENIVAVTSVAAKDTSAVDDNLIDFDVSALDSTSDGVGDRTKDDVEQSSSAAVEEGLDSGSESPAAQEESYNLDDIFAGGDEIATRLDLARSYIEMDDHDSARTMLDEVIEEGDEEQVSEAKELLNKI